MHQKFFDADPDPDPDPGCAWPGEDGPGAGPLLAVDSVAGDGDGDGPDAGPLLAFGAAGPAGAAGALDGAAAGAAGSSKNLTRALAPLRHKPPTMRREIMACAGQSPVGPSSGL